MSIKKTILYAAVIALLGTTNSSVLATILKNNSIWNIKYKIGKPEQKVYTGEHVLPAGEEMRIDIRKPISIRRSGAFSSVLSDWTQVPILSGFVGTDDEVIEIGGMSATGWTFSPYRIMR